MESKKKKNRPRRSTAKKQPAAAVPAAIQSPQTESEFTGNVVPATSGEETSGASPYLSSQEKNQAQHPAAPDSASNPSRMDGTSALPPEDPSSPSCCGGCPRCCYSSREQEILELTHGAIASTLGAVKILRKEKESNGQAVTNNVDAVAGEFLKMINAFVFPSIQSSLSTLRDLAQQKKDQPTCHAIGVALDEVDGLIALHDMAREFLECKKANQQQLGGTNAVDSGRDSSSDDGKGPDGSGGDKIVD